VKDIRCITILVNLIMVHTRTETCSYWATVHLPIKPKSYIKKGVSIKVHKEMLQSQRRGKRLSRQQSLTEFCRRAQRRWQINCMWKVGYTITTALTTTSNANNDFRSRLSINTYIRTVSFCSRTTAKETPRLLWKQKFHKVYLCLSC
jgi:hypothetical protein